MDIASTIIAAIAGTIGVVVGAWLNSRAGTRKADAEADSLEVSDALGIAREARAYVAELQERMTKLEMALDAERTERRKLERKLDMIITWVQREMPEDSVNKFREFLAGLDTVPL